MNLFRETGVVHRITYSFSDFSFLLMFYLFILFLIQNMECFIELKDWIIF